MTFASIVAAAAAAAGPTCAKTVVAFASILMLIIRASYGQRSRSLPVVASRGTRAETSILAISTVTYFFPLIWIATPLFDFADYELRAIPFYAGGMCLLFGMFLFRRSHADLGDNFSHTLQVRAAHRLTTHGVYHFVRHPMYASLFIYLTGQALVIANWVAGPAELAAMLLLFALRVKPEERLLLEAFGTEYRTYAATTKRLAPRVW